jgi:hypothetical protein
MLAPDIDRGGWGRCWPRPAGRPACQGTRSPAGRITVRAACSLRPGLALRVEEGSAGHALHASRLASFDCLVSPVRWRRGFGRTGPSRRERGTSSRGPEAPASGESRNPGRERLDARRCGSGCGWFGAAGAARAGAAPGPGGGSGKAPRGRVGGEAKRNVSCASGSCPEGASAGGERSTRDIEESAAGLRTCTRNAAHASAAHKRGGGSSGASRGRVGGGAGTPSGT